MARTATKPVRVPGELWDEMSAAEKYNLVLRFDRTDAYCAWAFRLAASALVSFIAIAPLQEFVYQHVSPEHMVKFGRENDPRDYLDESAPLLGDELGGFPVTSIYGFRTHPVSGLPDNHRGVDVGTPAGTPLYAPAVGSDRVTVTCWTDDQGGGLVANIASESVKGYTFKAAHLKNCTPGTHAPGEVFAETGSSGVGTAAHLHFMQAPVGTDRAMSPMAGYIDWVLSGSAGANIVDIPALKDAIAEQESNHDYFAVNRDAVEAGLDVALGKYQVMDFNIEHPSGPGHGWDVEALGKDISTKEFLNSPELQEKVVTHQLEQIARSLGTQSDEQAASQIGGIWYSGSPDCGNTQKQFYGDGEYPSVASYCDAIGEKYTARLRD